MHAPNGRGPFMSKKERSNAAKMGKGRRESSERLRVLLLLLLVADRRRRQNKNEEREREREWWMKWKGERKRGQGFRREKERTGLSPFRSSDASNFRALKTILYLFFHFCFPMPLTFFGYELEIEWGKLGFYFFTKKKDRKVGQPA